MGYIALNIGTTLHMGTYKIMKVLGQGGFGITYLAHDMNLDKPVAIKEFFPESLCSRDGSTSHITLGTQSTAEMVFDLKARFLKEARNIAKLNHPNIIRIFTAFEENNTAYYVMEYVHGASLAQIVEKLGPLSEANAKKYIDPVGDALEYLHSNHMTHLDVKPANIMVRNEDDCPILIDFGLAKNYDQKGAATTTRGPLGVSPGYSPAEQYIMTGNSLFSPKSDLYSLGATFYYLLTGMVPPEGPMNVSSSLPFPANVSQNVRDAIIMSMSSLPDNRQRSVKEFLEQVNTPGLNTGPKTVVAPVYQEPQTTKNNSKKSLTTGILAAIAIVALAIAGIAIFSNKGGNSNPKYAAETYAAPEAEAVSEEVSASASEPEVSSEYGPFATRQALINFIESFYHTSGQGIVDTSYFADNIETDFGSKVQFTRSSYANEMKRYWKQQKFIEGTYDFNWSSMKCTPTSDGGVEVYYNYIYNMVCERDDLRFTRQFNCTTTMTINNKKEISAIRERNKKLDEWYSSPESY